MRVRLTAIRLQTNQLNWFDPAVEIHMREIADSTVRLLEDLDAARDRSVVLFEECMSQAQDQLNSKMYLLSIVAVIFMPLTFITGLLGINVAGIPSATSKFAFLFVCLMLLGIAILQLIWLKRKRWI